MAGCSIPIRRFRGPDWKKEFPEEWTFNDRLDFERFHDLVRHLYPAVLSFNQYNTISSFNTFYKSFKESGVRSLSEFYHGPYEPRFSTHSLSSVGLCHVLKKELRKVLKDSPFEDIRQYIYCAAGCVVPNDDPTASIEGEEVFWPVEQTELVCLALKFSLYSRKGYMLMNFEYGLGVPIIVMEDGADPHSVPTSSSAWTGPKQHTTRQLNDKYILWTIKEHQTRTIYRVFYMKRAFRRLDYPEKRLKVNPMQGALVFVENKPKAGYCTDTDSIFGCISGFASGQSDYLTTKIMYGQIFFRGEVKDMVLKSCVVWLAGDSKEKLAEFVSLCSDEDFKRQLIQLHEDLTARVYSAWNDPAAVAVQVNIVPNTPGQPPEGYLPEQSAP